jgi:hypothetical protein
MKPLKTALALAMCLLIPVLCFAQTQTGEASYNASKSGLTISHAAMSFNTRVKVTNLSNNREVIATVNGRIPASDPRVADISKDAGEAIGMSAAGLTRVRLEQLQPEQGTAPAAAPVPAPTPAPPPPATPAPAQRSTPAPAAPAPSSQEPVIENIQVISESPPVQYIITPPAAPFHTCVYFPLCLAILILLIIAVLLLTAILILILCMRRIPWWPGFTPWYTPVWLRRHLRYLKNRRY